MKFRNLLYVDLGRNLDTDLREKLSNDWVLRTARDARSVEKQIHENCCFVGIARFNNNDELCDPDLIDALLSAPHMKWVAVLQRSALETANAREVISQNFFDYHHLPVDFARLQQVLGHAYGKAQLEAQVAEEQDATQHIGVADGLVGNSAAISSLRRQIMKAC